MLRNEGEGVAAKAVALLHTLVPQMFYCPKCGVLDGKGTLLTHRCSAVNKPSQTAINMAPAINRGAINNVDASRKAGNVEDLSRTSLRLHRKPQKVRKQFSAGRDQGSGDGSSVLGGNGNRTPNRRDRADYNAYMREYMRKRRNGEGH